MTYTPPLCPVSDDWADYRSETFTPSPRQAVILGAVRSALASGLHYVAHLREAVIASLRLDADGAYDRVTLSHEVYYAREAIRAQKAWRRHRAMSLAITDLRPDAAAGGARQAA
ncbi:hypothetical protein E4T66_18545 [Sinimarinibacterium sp. CAU 1509]|uniref:hypothetical protein n=1 Tax=Sinimarinibacterium sp. CAU 1509 TaxID=2562283 RepID=UPI0010AC19B8|nr:hypothetical protein [Sinimarinibacterium sp. CAU 1509]TJY57407.1 hypothetical protein E4T66_18545 [Sinimarinibacterium sp. CAU 1509]